VGEPAPTPEGTPGEAPASQPPSPESARATPEHPATTEAPVRKGPIPDEEPANLTEQLAMDAARSGEGDVIMRSLSDTPRLEANYGPGEWVKMQHTHRVPDGRQVNIHWFRNLTTGQNVQFKFKIRL
jgi:hypothetical protein